MKKVIVFFIIIIMSMPMVTIGTASAGDDIVLPPPSTTTMNLEETIWRRASIRNFTKDPISDQDLSTILWAAYGIRGDGSRTVPTINGLYAVKIYVVRQEAVYTYDPANNTLVFYKTGDYRFIGQYEAPLLLGFVWDQNISTDGDLAAAQMGMIGQNVHFMVNALGMGTVVNGDFSPTYTLERIGLPDNEVPRIIMPIGYLVFPYNFKDLPVWISFLPKVQRSTSSLSDALEARNETNAWEGELSRKETIQMLWSSYGYSYYVDQSDFGFIYHISRHRTVPSAHGYYVLRIYAVTEDGTYEYIPNIYNPLYGPLRLIYLLPKFPFPVVTYLKKINDQDQRAAIADASESPAIATAPMITVIILDLEQARIGRDDFSGEEWWWLWYYEVGSAAQNMLLESAAWDLSTNIVLPTDAAAIRSTLGLNESYVPTMIVPVGNP